jgi:hypothetical protein
MERFLARLERRFGRFAIPNLTYVIVFGMALVWILGFVRPEFVAALELDLDAVKRGQVWRLVTFLLVPPPTSSIWVIVSLYVMWWVGTSVEQHWGSFKYNVFYFTGALGTIVSAVLLGGASNYILNESVFLAFGTLFPDVQILLMFIIPIRAKWLALLAGASLALFFAMGDWALRGAIVAAVGNYLLFFTGHWVSVFRGRALQVKQAARRAEFRSSASAASAPFGQRVCAMCGAREADGADIRVCSCEKCTQANGGKARALCLEHARNH